MLSGRLMPLLLGKMRELPPPGASANRPLFLKTRPVSPLANLEAISTDSTVNYGPILLREKDVEERGLISM